MKVILNDKSGVILKTANKHCKEDIEVSVETEELTITPSIEEQVNEGLYNKVTVQPMENLTDDLTEQDGLVTTQETTIDDILEVLENKAFPSVELQEKTVIPTTEEQEIVADEGYDALSKVIVAGDEDLKPENIKDGTSIFGVEGTAKTTNAKITDATELFYKGRRTDCIEELISLCNKVSSTSNMFSYCQKLTELDVSKLDTSNSTSMYAMFEQCVVLASLDVSNFDTSNVTTMNGMFVDCYLIETLDLSNFDTSKVTNMSRMFRGCKKLTNVDVSNFDTSSVTSMDNMFVDCQALTELDISNFDMSNVNSANYMFSGCNKLVNLKFGTNLGKGYKNWSSHLNLSYSTNLTHESLMGVINNLYDLNLTYDVANGGTLYTQNLVLGSKNLAKLTAEEIAIATDKGWNVT